MPAALSSSEALVTEEWAVVRRAQPAGARVARFVAESDLMRMIGGVLRAREARLVQAVATDLDEALRLARVSGAEEEVLERLQKMASLARLVDAALTAFLRTARLDVSRAAL
jgi:hypothetical protein